MTAPAATAPRVVVDDPIDALVPPPRTWWVRLLIAVATVLLVGFLGFAWHFGAIRPNPDCCGTSSASAFMGQSSRPDAVTVTAQFFNSSSRAITLRGASADLPGATVVDVTPFAGQNSFEFPARNLGTFPLVVAGHGSASMAVTFFPNECADTAKDEQWGVVKIDLAVADDHWYPTFGRSYDVPVVEAGLNQIVMLPPAELDEVFINNSFGPLESACILLGR